MSNPITKEGGLIVTFYGPREQEMLELKKEVGLAFGLIKAHYNFQDISDIYREIFLRHFDPPAAYDTRVVQLALNGSDTACVAWESLRKQLEEDVNLAQILAPFAQQDTLWGYTLIYHATLLDKDALDNSQKLEQLLLPARRPASLPPKKQRALAKSEQLESQLYLLDIPNDGEGIKAATVYVALSSPEKEQTFLAQVLYGAAASLLMPDLIAHKAYWERRQYVEEPRRLYRQRIEESQKIVSALLDLSRDREQLKDGSSEANQLLEQLSATFTKLLEATQLLEDLRLSLAQQLVNYTWWAEQLGESELTKFHHSHMQIAHRDLDLLIGKGQSMMEASRTAIEMVRTRLEQLRQAREQQNAKRIAILGLIFAVFQVVDPSLAQTILDIILAVFQFIASKLAPAIMDWLNGPLSIPIESYERALQWAVQMAIAGGLMIWLYRRWR